MIDLDVIAYLKADSDLDTLLGSTASNAKMYPNYVPENETLPYIAYYTNSVSFQGIVVNECSMTFDCMASTYKSAGIIADRLIVLLSKQDQIEISSDTFRIFFCGSSGGADDYQDELGVYSRSVNFNFKYRRKE